MKTRQPKTYGIQYKAVLRGGFIAIQAYLMKQEKHHINNLSLYLKQLEKQKNHKVINRRKEIVKIRADIYEKETKETTAKINKTESQFFEKINKIDKPLARLIKKKRGKNQIDKTISESGEDNTEIQKVIRDYYEQQWTTCKKWTNSYKSITFQN